MEDGIYMASLTANNEPIGEGIVVFRDGIFNGGGQGYLYKGVYEQATDTIKGELLLYRKGHATVFGEKHRYTLVLHRDKQQAKLIFSGQLGADPTRIVMTELVWQESLAH
jgi:hypothetical protein